MNKAIFNRTMQVGRYAAANGATIRELARIFGVSKSTIHKDLTERLPEVDSELYKKVREKLNYNKSMCHLRGGQQTRERYRTYTRNITGDSPESIS